MTPISRIVPDCCSNRAASCCGSIPGTGMNVPMRNTTSAPTRNNSRCRTSVKVLPLGWLRSVDFWDRFAMSTVRFDATARCFNGFAGPSRGGDTLERHGLGKFALDNDLGAGGIASNKTCGLERRQVDFAGQFVQAFQAHLGSAIDAAVEAPLGYTPLQRHLAAFEAD